MQNRRLYDRTDDGTIAIRRKGESCEFSTDDSTCYASRDQAACSGNGYCENGKCVCYQVNQRSYSGKYCEDGPVIKTLCLHG